MSYVKKLNLQLINNFTYVNCKIVDKLFLKMSKYFSNMLIICRHLFTVRNLKKKYLAMCLNPYQNQCRHEQLKTRKWFLNLWHYRKLKSNMKMLRNLIIHESVFMVTFQEYYSRMWFQETLHYNVPAPNHSVAIRQRTHGRIDLI